MGVSVTRALREKIAEFSPTVRKPDSFLVGFESCKQKGKRKKGGNEDAALMSTTGYNGFDTKSYRPAAAAADFATAGIMPAIFMLSIRFRIFSVLAPVSTHAST